MAVDEVNPTFSNGAETGPGWIAGERIQVADGLRDFESARQEKNYVGIGFVLFVYGKQQGRWPHLVAGLALSVYPWVATTVLTLVTVGLLIGFALWYAVRVGW